MSALKWAIAVKQRFGGDVDVVLPPDRDVLVYRCVGVDPGDVEYYLRELKCGDVEYRGVDPVRDYDRDRVRPNIPGVVFDTV